MRSAFVLSIFTMLFEMHERKVTIGRLVKQSKNRNKRHIKWPHMVRWRISKEALRKKSDIFI